jgi:hypothetical protein
MMSETSATASASWLPQSSSIFTLTADGRFEPLVEGSTKPVADPAACLHRQSEELRVQHRLNCPPAPNGSYRAYIVGDDGHFIGFEPLVCADDSEAIEKAKRLVSKNPVDIWSGERFVQRLDVPKPSGDAVTHEIQDGRMVPKK